MKNIIIIDPFSGMGGQDKFILDLEKDTTDNSSGINLFIFKIKSSLA